MTNTHIRSKRLKTKAIITNNGLKKYVPPTVALTKKLLKEMLEKYHMVYVKPDHGSSGFGVMKVEKIRGGSRYKYRYQIVKQRYLFHTYEELYTSIKMKSKGIPYVVQKGIHLLTYHHRPFDIRVMVQINPKGMWEVTGRIGRIAHPQKIVTNRKSGGDVLPLENILQIYLSPRKRRALINRINRLSLQIARHVQRQYPGLKEVGVDVGLDHSFKPWIIEINTRPVYKLFNALRDKRMVRRMITYARAYGRIVTL